MEFYSHKGKRDVLLKDHLELVGKRSKQIIKSKVLSGIDKNILADVSYLIGISHDFGKYTFYFQEKLNGLRDKKDKLTFHSLISGIFAYEVTTEYLNSKELLNKKPFKFLPLIAFFVVKHHHGNLNDIFEDTSETSLFDSGFPNISKQVINIFGNSSQIKNEYAYLLSEYSISIDNVFSTLEIFLKEIKNSDVIKELLKTTINKSSHYFKKEDEIIYYLITQLLYSVLIDSDKKHAGQVREINRKTIDENLVENYLVKSDFQKTNVSKINSIRNNIRNSVLKNINSHNKIFTITAPTGTGKTLTSFSAALKLRKLLKSELNLDYEPRIIYSLPFTSIIDQSFDVFDNVLKTIDDFEVFKSEYLLKHHYLSEVFYKTKELDKEKDVDESLALIESWESEIVITTFIQLFHTLIGYKNRSLKKFHNIVNSIIILDEVQNIPIEYWNLVYDVLIALTNYFNCRIILMTATKPLIFNDGEYLELVENYEDYFKSPELNRVTLKYNPSKTIDELYFSLNSFSLNSYLFVFNTIRSSIDFYSKIKNIKGYEFIYLSTNIIPKERKQRIDKIKKIIKENKEKKKKQKFIVVTTQLIEAGVDIDCEIAFRDYSTLDSIIQVAGRCNRNSNLSNSDVFLMNLRDDRKEYAYYIYSHKLLDITKEIIKNHSGISEKDFLGLINEYFTKAKNAQAEETDLIKSIRSLCYDVEDKDKKPISSFKLIKEDYIKHDVFVEIDDNAKDVWGKYDKLKDIEHPIERKNEFLKFKKEFYDYVISLPEKYFQETPSDFVYHLNFDKIQDQEIEYYNSNTGFNRKSELPKEISIVFL